ncbi:P-loop containing nucleoside triphosphate hydrolase protein [Metschnikowia bicuspidata]|uniref:P-loop containing nucleoside triphosphate hydrolase protein n=1 Tax=Metschnikowia bicuspidata TaxID=27322 RepID=A0A4P9Z8F8_9ASCO|nr:P-loop containing nucleoside triphosphate hydrolase protein [Metschnikowia bicuspidata]
MTCQLWDFDDFTHCARTNAMFYVPVAVAGSSAAVLLVKSLVSCTCGRGRAAVSLAEENKPLLDSSDAYGAISLAATTEPRMLKARHFDLTQLPNTNDDGMPHGVTKEVTKGTGDRLRVALEFVLVVAQLAVAVATRYLPAFHKEWKALPVSWALVGFWGYATLFSAIRVINLSRVRLRLPSLWAHSTTLYFFFLFPSVVFFRSALNASVKSSIVTKYYIGNFAAVFALVALTFTAKVGDKPGVLYVPSDGAKPSPEKVSSLWSCSTYSWIDGMIWKAYKKPLTMGDIWGLREDDHSLHVLKEFQTAKLRHGFTLRLFTHFKGFFFVQALWAILQSMLVFIPTLLLKKMLEYVADQSTSTRSIVWGFMLLMPLSKIADSLSSGFSLFLGRRVCVRMRSIIIGEIYAKALRRKITASEIVDSDKEKDEKAAEVPAEEASPATAKQEAKSSELGAIINLVAIDAFKVSEICGYLHFFVVSILMLLICIALLYNLLGWSALAGGSAIILLLPLYYLFSNWVGRAQLKMLLVTDRRIQKLNETFCSIRIIKFFAWENKFFDDIMKIREEEMKYLSLRCAIWSAQGFIWFLVPTLITVISFSCYTVIEGKTLTAPVAFTALSLFTLLRSPLDQLTEMTAILIQSMVSLKRISSFLAEEETTKYEQLDHEPTPTSPLIGFECANFSWNSKSDKDFKLRDIDVTFCPGKLNVIVGPTGSGKTSLLLALLGEMEHMSGKVYLPGIIPRDDLVVDPKTGLTESVAYCSQAAWLLNDTIRNNIRFTSPFNQERYNKVVEACSLRRDFEILAAGDQTEIGEKGIALSGGQKQRVSLARALYSNSRHVLLDDCLSAVDSHTAAWIYDNCITGPLMANRTCLLVSHNVALAISSAEWVVVMHNGRVKAQGAPEDLAANGDFGSDEMVLTLSTNSRTQSSTSLKALETKNAEMKAKAAAVEAKLKRAQADDDENVKSDGKLVEEEGKADGVVSLDVYVNYSKEFGGFAVWAGILVVFIIPQCIFFLQAWWLRNWSQAATRATVHSVGYVANLNRMVGSVVAAPTLVYNVVVSVGSDFASAVSAAHAEKSTIYYIGMYGLIGTVYALCATFKLLWVFFAGVTASNNIFKHVLNKVLRARLRFFDKTPLGRIMNRFSKDIESVDQELIPFAEGAFACFISCVSVLVVIAFITPGFLVFAVLIAYLYYLVGVLYLTLSRELKRFDSITKSPIHQHFSESLTGVATIRACGVENRFMRQNLAAVDTNNRPFFYMWVANRWLCFRVDIVGSLVMFFAGVFVLMSIGSIDAGLAGLSLSYAISFSESALWIMRLYANIEMNMNSVERLQEFERVEQEPPAEIPGTKPDSSWPTAGEIDVRDVSLRYVPELPRVIKNVSFHVQACHKVGIVGRTGAGKSTIITAFFRFMDLDSGEITIDGVNISHIGLADLRQALTIIPQEPTLFTGTIRSNLDPFEQYTEEQIFEALTRVNLIARDERTATTAVSLTDNQNKFLDLATPITEGGSNLSQGQRQLMCLARSLLKSPKVILLDEATASIDYESDALIQKTIRDEFSGLTILTIAHRLRSIIDYDRILVMDAGRVVEYDDPYVLIANPESLFYSMCENSGELETLKKLAKAAYVDRKNAAK